MKTPIAMRTAPPLYCLLATLATVSAQDISGPWQNSVPLPPPPPLVVESRMLRMAEPRPIEVSDKGLYAHTPGVVVYRFTPGGEVRVRRVGMGGFNPEPPRPDGLIDLFGGEANFRQVLARESVTLARLRAERLLNLTDRVDYMESELRPLAPADAAALRALLAKDDAFDWSALREDAPRYAVRLKLGATADALAVDVDLSRRWLRVMRKGETVAEASFAFGSETLARITDRY